MTIDLTDLNSHHIEGMLADGRQMRIPLISEILPGFWTGGCKQGVRLPHDFAFVLSLYPWEAYHLGPNTERVEVRLYDSKDVPAESRLLDLARQVNIARSRGNVLVHCQAGLNRSGLIAGLALVEDGMAPEAAIALLREKRDPLVLCNGAFERWLLRRTPPRAARAAA